MRLLIVLFEIDLVGAPPSVFISPENDAAPVNVILEKLLLFQLTTEPVDELAFVLRMVTAPPVPGFAKAVTIELPLILSVPVAGSDVPSVKKVNAPVEFIERLVNVLLSYTLLATVAVFIIIVIADVVAAG